ncbi:MAG: twin-arginine translocation signal domain-containing protein [Planctomycetes bacterium]|nr:twin-arginine translocation signal domain-containing protein [Planctomycetota bacterium]
MAGKSSSVSRRNFVKAAAAAAAFTIVNPKSVRGTPAASKLALGIVGAGGRGTFVGTRFAEHPEIQVAALADLYNDRLEAARAAFKVPPERCFRGFEA